MANLKEWRRDAESSAKNARLIRTGRPPKTLVTFKILDLLFMFFGCLQCIKRAQISSLICFRIFFD
jgi:hypothetical protein